VPFTSAVGLEVNEPDYNQVKMES